MSELSFSPANQEDVPLLTGILTDATMYKLDLGDQIWGTEGWTEEEVQGAMTESTIYLVREGSEVIGTVSLQWDDERNWGEQPPVAGYLHRLAIREGFHGQGLGERIVDWAAKRVAEKDRQFLRLDCEETNAELCGYYKKLGFVQVGTRPVPEYSNYVAALFEKPVV